MYSFIICFLILVASYFIYGKIVEKVAGTDETRETPAYRLQDGIDYIPMSKIKNFLVHFLPPLIYMHYTIQKKSNIYEYNFIQDMI